MLGNSKWGKLNPGLIYDNSYKPGTKSIKNCICSSEVLEDAITVEVENNLESLDQKAAPWWEQQEEAAKRSVHVLLFRLYINFIQIVSKIYPDEIRARNLWFISSLVLNLLLSSRR
jgi:hypothetical protein